MRNVLTIDLEEYFCVEAYSRAVDPGDWDSFPSRVEEQAERLLRILDDHGARATFFVVGWTAERHPDLVREIRRRGHEIGCHGYRHDRVDAFGPRAFRRDVRRGRLVLERILGAPPLGYRAPTFSVTLPTLWALPILAEEGFSYDSSIVPVRHDRYGIPGARSAPYTIPTGEGRRIHELPPLTRPVPGGRLAVGGGGWLRLLPLGLVAGGIRRMNERGEPAVIYLHPWELDPDQPRVPGAGRRARWRHFVGMERMEGKLRRLLAEFPFTTAADLLDLPDPRPAASAVEEPALVSTARAGRTSSSC